MIAITAATDKDLLENSHDVRVVTCLGRQRVNDRRNVHFACCIHLLIDIGGNVLAALLQECDIRRVAHFGDNLQSRVNLLYGFVDEDILRI